MTDLESRAFVADALVDSFISARPSVDIWAIHKAVAEFVNAIIDNYLRCRLLGTTPKGRPS